MHRFLLLLLPTLAFAGHTVLVEGINAANGAPGITTATAGTGGDFDGDGIVGTAEDTDNAFDRIFGTLKFALSGTNGGVNLAGRVSIVTSGRFPEAVAIVGANGDVTIEAAPGVDAVIDANVQGNPAPAPNDTGTLLESAGFTIDAPATRVVTLRNLTIRNFATGILVRGVSRVHLDHCRIENCRDFGVRVIDTAKLTMTNCQVVGAGLRVGAGKDTANGDTPQPGHGLAFEGTASGLLSEVIVRGSFATGLVGNTRRIVRKNVLLFDNAKNFAPK